MRDAIDYLLGILRDEIELLGGDASNVFIMGMSQGGAIGMWTLLAARAAAGELGMRLGGFVGTSTWLPFARDLGRYLGPGGEEGEWKMDEFVVEMMAPLKIALDKGSRVLADTPVFLGHGVDDGVVDVELGRQARDVLRGIGMDVRWKEYEGAELEGHWLKVPEEVDDVLAFLQEVSATR